MGSYTEKQGQYLAFIYYYTKLNNRSPAEADFQRYFGVSPSAVHQMILNLEKQRFIERVRLMLAGKASDVSVVPQSGLSARPRQDWHASPA